MIQDAMECQEKDIQLSLFWVLRDTRCIKVKIRPKVASLVLLTFWNVPLPEILILDAVYFQKLPDLVHENSS